VRRLTRSTTRRPRWARLRGQHGERGGIAVATALLLPVFLGLAALAVDTAGVWAARQQVVNGADAAVLAVATDCAQGNCGDIKATSESYFFANDEAAKLADLKAGSGWIYVNGRQVRTTSTWLIQHFFAGALGYPTGSLSVESTAAWAPVVTSTSDVAFALSWCTYSAAIRATPVNSLSRTTRIDLTTKTDGSCTGPAGASVTAGAMWTTPTSGASCGTAAAVQTPVSQSLPATGKPSGCTAGYLAGLVGKTLDIPVWDAFTGGGAPSARVYGWAAFQVASVDSTSATPSLTGYFVWEPRQVGDSTVPTTAAPDLGARAVFLTDPSTWTGPTCQNGSSSC
jgi:Flp pilus assembly protein TadG